MIRICSEIFREHINDSSRSKRQTLETLASSDKPFRSGLSQAPRRGFGGQQHQKLHLKRNITLSKSSRYHNGAQCGYRNSKYEPGNLAQQRSAISSSHTTSTIKNHLSKLPLSARLSLVEGNLFLVSKRDKGNMPVKNLKYLNEFVPYQHFKMKGLHWLKNVSKKDDCTHKLYMKDAYFPIPLNLASTKFVRFFWAGKLYQFQCLCFGLGTSTKN